MFSVRIDLHRDCVKSLFETFFLMRDRHFCRDFTTSRTERTDARIYWAASTSSWMIPSSCLQDTGTSPPYCRRCNWSEKRSERNRSEDKNLKRKKVEDNFSVTEVLIYSWHDGSVIVFRSLECKMYIPQKPNCRLTKVFTRHKTVSSGYCPDLSSFRINYRFFQLPVF